MRFAIKLFQCTDLGVSALYDQELQSTLSENEISILKIIHDYHSRSSDDSELSAINNRFQMLYERVNLTKLVVLRLLKFEEVDVEEDLVDPENNYQEKTVQITPVDKPLEDYLYDPSDVEPIFIVASGKFNDF